MDLSYGEAAEAFRAEVRAFLSLHWPPPSDMRGADLRQFIRTFRAHAIDQGYLYRAIPKPYGGSGQPVDAIRAQVIRGDSDRAAEYGSAAGRESGGREGSIPGGAR